MILLFSSCPKKEGIFTDEPIQRQEPLFSSADLRRLILPLIVEQFLAIAIGMADTIMVTSVGEAAVSGVSLVDSINLLVIQVFSALATGGAVVTSQYLGHRDNRSACRAAKQLIYGVAAAALVLTAVCLLSREHLLRLIFGAIDADVMDSALAYLLLTAASYPLIAIYNAGAALFRSMGNSKVSMLASLVVNLINVAGNAVFIYGFHLGAAGAGLGTLLSRVAAAGIMLFLICQPGHPVFVSQLWKPEFEPAMLKRILRIGIPSGLENGMFQAGKLMVSSLISSLGTAAIAANAIANSIGSVPNIPGNAIALALITLMGHSIGAGRPEEGARYARRLMGMSYLYLFGTGLILFFGAGPLVSFFDLSPEATAMAVQVLQWHGVCSALLWTPSFVLPCGLRAAGDAKFPMAVSIFSMFAFRVFLSYALVWYTPLGLLGVWIAMFADWICRDVFFLARFLRGKWKTMALIG